MDKALSAVSGQEIEITLQSIGPGQYGTPTISSSAIEFVDVTLSPIQNPGGPTQIFRFKAVAAGSATITIDHTDARRPFSVSLVVN